MGYNPVCFSKIIHRSRLLAGDFFNCVCARWLRCSSASQKTQSMDCHCFYSGLWMRKFAWSRAVFAGWRLGWLRRGHGLSATFLPSAMPAGWVVGLGSPAPVGGAGRGALVPNLAIQAPCVGSVCADISIGNLDKEKLHRGMHGWESLHIYLYLCVYVGINSYVYMNIHKCTLTFLSYIHFYGHTIYFI